jgi:hypothetical protein
VSTLLEWDAKIPEFSVVHAEVQKAKKYWRESHAFSRQAQPTAARAMHEPFATSRQPVVSPVSNPLAFIVADVE